MCSWPHVECCTHSVFGNHGSIIIHISAQSAYNPHPFLSGDVARMLSDHPDLTLAALKKTHSEDPRQFGLALGNMRYLLAEVLKGLAYILMHIVHVHDIRKSI